MTNHRKFEKLLTDLALGELSAPQAAELQGHLSACPKCRAQLKRAEALLQHAGELQAVSADEQACESAKQSLLLALQNQEPKKSASPSRLLAMIRRTLMNKPMTKFATVVIIVTAIVLGIYSFRGPVNLATPAFGIDEVIAATQEVQWMHIGWKSPENNDPDFAKKLGGLIDHSWLCANPHREVTIMADGTIWFSREDATRAESYNPKTNIITKHHMPHVSKRVTGANLIELLMNQITHGEEHAGAKVEYRDGIEDGQPARIITVNHSKSDGAGAEMSIIVDLDTRLSIKMSILWNSANGEGVGMSGVCDYPAVGPNTIYEAGAPADAEIIEEAEHPVD